MRGDLAKNSVIAFSLVSSASLWPLYKHLDIKVTPQLDVLQCRPSSSTGLQHLTLVSHGPFETEKIVIDA